ncbi:aminoglycoside adenylyltransferase domain-containing protein [Clostridium oryzae]|uniref:Streptomycin 3''-adenylyltransferase n=1 Tax=Clostridium oryzae TaxID=1450648 RepID=A0A1V4IHU4_9CLOT|nr:aminoglycoside adenylyltransferase domain-containing protein [Clostridium oryzae]OPJ59394.1 streptomycin 3''-adenylyltransferase [Clostridium oryzae]
MNYKLVLDKIKEEYSNILKDNLVGIYVHGSIAFNCFNWNKSDIDFIVVVKEKISKGTKLQLMKVTTELNAVAPPKGLEMSVVLEKYCNNFQYPTPFELHFSNMHMEWYKNNADDYCEKMNGVDADLAAHFTVIKRAGIVLCGQAIDEVFAIVPKEYYIDSIKSDIEDAKSAIIDNPIYMILNLCRVCAYTKQELILSKEQGARWGLEHLIKKYHSIINRAMHCYQSNEQMTIEKEEAEGYCDYMLRLIFDSI